MGVMAASARPANNPTRTSLTVEPCLMKPGVNVRIEHATAKDEIWIVSVRYTAVLLGLYAPQSSIVSAGRAHR